MQSCKSIFVGACLVCLTIVIAGCKESAATPTWSRAASAFNSHTSDSDLNALAREIAADATSHLAFENVTRTLPCGSRSILLGTVVVVDTNQDRWFDVALRLEDEQCDIVSTVYWSLSVESQIKQMPTFLTNDRHFSKRAVTLASNSIAQWNDVPEWKATIAALPTSELQRIYAVDSPIVVAFRIIVEGRRIDAVERAAVIGSLPEFLRSPFEAAVQE
jgi:hypothetical protein